MNRKERIASIAEAPCLSQTQAGTISVVYKSFFTLFIFIQIALLSTTNPESAWGLADLPGDIDGDGQNTLTDVVSGLKVLTGQEPSVTLEGDANSDNRINFPEVLYSLQLLSTSESMDIYPPEKYIYSDSFEDHLFREIDPYFDWSSSGVVGIATGAVDENSGNFLGYSFLTDGDGGPLERIDLDLQTFPIPQYGTKKGQGFSNDYAMSIKYGAEQHWSEFRFDLGKPYKELWIRYWLRVPTNYSHQYPKVAGSNNKLFAMWMDNYSQNGTGATAVWENWRTDADDGSSQLAWHYRDVPTATNTGHRQHFDFITVPQDRGRWMQIVLHLKVSSATGVEDGVLETYRRWSDEEQFTLYHQSNIEKFSLPPSDDKPQGWQRGYFMGYSNTGFAEETYFLIDGVEFSETELLNVVGIWDSVH